MSKQEAPTTPLEVKGGDPTIPIEEGPAASVPTAPVFEEPPTTGLTSPGGGAHDEGDPGTKEAWTMTKVSRDAARVGAETAGGAPSSGCRIHPQLLS